MFGQFVFSILLKQEYEEKRAMIYVKLVKISNIAKKQRIKNSETI